ncbi:MAG TPA: FAD-dependent monooxygenase [Egibacteraceae bacterium]|nr:FAD-dependent monooxygenase [Egibacteraceae bacterium]
MDRRAPVVVVGAGPVGMTAALALRARGIDDVVVVDAEPAERRRPGSRAIFQHRASLELYERNAPGLGWELARRGLVWPTKRTLFNGREVYARTYPPWRGDRLPPLTSLPQTEIETALLARCKAAGVTPRWRWPVASVHVDDGGVALVGPDQARLSARYVVAADGARSTVRSTLGIKLAGDRSPSPFVIVDVAEDPRAPLPVERIYHYRHPAVGGRNVLLVPFAGGWRADLQLRPDDDPEQFNTTDGAHAWVSRVLPPRYAERITWVSTYRFLQAVAERFVDDAGRVLLAGEAAHVFAPFGARGLNSGVADADAAAAAVVQALQAANPAVAGAAVDAFDADRREAARYNRDAAKQALAFMEARDPLLRARQEVAARLAPRIPRLGRWLDAAPYGPRLDHGRRGGY